MLSEPAMWDALMAKLAETFAGYVAAKVAAGADVIQLFDSWVGALSPTHYRERVAPWSARVLAAVDVPTIHFGTGAGHLLEELAAAGGDVIGLDWRTAARRRLGARARPRRPGESRSGSVLARRGRSSSARRSTCSRGPLGGPGHVFNLGHGVLPGDRPGHADAARGARARAHAAQVAA